MRAPRTMEAKYWVDHAVDSEALTTMAEPVYRVEMIGLMKLWN